MAVVAFMAGTISTSYGQTRDQKSFSERDNVRQSDRNKADSQQDYKEVQRKSDYEFLKFKKESQATIRNNEKKISDIKRKFSKFSSREKAEFQRNLRIVEQKNAKLKRQLSNYRERQQDKWMSFKRDFNRDLNEVSNSLRDFKIENKRHENR